MFFSRRRGPTEPGANAASVPTLTSLVAAFFGALARVAATVGCAGAIVSAAAVFLGALDFLAVVVDFLVRIGRSLMGYSSLLAGGRTRIVLSGCTRMVPNSANL